MMLRLHVILLSLICLNLKLVAQSQFQKALYLNGEQQYLEIPDASYLNHTSQKNFTVELLLKQESIKPANVMNKWDPDNEMGQGFFLNLNMRSDISVGPLWPPPWQTLFNGIDDPGLIMLGLASSPAPGSGVRGLMSIPTAMEVDAWYHIVAIQTDGLLERTTLYFQSEPGPSFGHRPDSNVDYGTPGQPLCLGGLPIEIDTTLDKSLYFTGFIEELRIWNTLRDSEQFHNTMYDTLGPEYYTNPDSGLVAYYRFDQLEDLGVGQDGLANDIRDLSVNGNHANVFGGAQLRESGVITTVRSVREEIPRSFQLYQNYPNPFNPATNIRFELKQAAHVDLSVYDMLGRKTRVLARGRLPAGSHDIRWDGKDDSGLKVASGLYFYQLKVGEQSQIRRMSLLR